MNGSQNDQIIPDPDCGGDGISCSLLLGSKFVHIGTIEMKSISERRHRNRTLLDDKFYRKLREAGKLIKELIEDYEKRRP